jgi:hypothetical protein
MEDALTAQVPDLPQMSSEKVLELLEKGGKIPDVLRKRLMGL